MANEYLTRTPTSSGNRRVFTWSGWVKLNSNPGAYLFTASPTKDNVSMVRVIAGGSVEFFDRQGSDPSTEQVRFNPLLRDYGSWTHILMNADTTQTLASFRVRAFINGVELSRDATNTLLNNSTATDTPPKNQEFWRLNGANYAHYIGALLDNTLAATDKTQYSDVFFIDGQALTPDVFGKYIKGNGYISAGSTQATDFRKGQWVPKAPRVIRSVINARGGFGVNGFYLPMNSSTNFGADFHCDPNSIIRLNEELAQPKVGIATTAAVGSSYTDVLRTDPLKDYLVLALPLVSGGLQSGFGDYAPSIKGSGTVKTVTANGNVSIANTASYYGSAAYFDGTGDYLDVESSLDYNLASSDYTIEAWVYPISLTTAGNYKRVWDLGSALNTAICLTAESGDNTFKFRYNDTVIITSVSTVKLNQWTHVAFVRESSRVSLYINGVAEAVASHVSAHNFGSNTFRVGANKNDATNSSWNGYIQDLRFYKGVAKYKGGFDVPRPYTPVGIATWRAVPDTTANNFANLNGVTKPVKYTVSNGNLTFTNSTSDWTGWLEGTVGFSTGKYYWETRIDVSTDYHHIGIVGVGITHFNTTNTYTYGMSYQADGRFWAEGNTGTAFAFSKPTATTVGHIVQVAVDMTNKKMWIGINETWIDSGNPALGTGENFNSTRGFNYTHYVPFYDSYGSSGLTINFGQNPTFSGSIGNFAFKTAKIYSVYSGGARSANYTVQYSDDNTNWTTAWTGVAANNSSCGIQQNSGGGGSYGVHRYWRYVEGSAVVGHHPRVSKIILSDGINDVNIVTYTSDNCSDTGEYVIGTITYDGKDGAGTYTDSNGKGLFKYQPPSGFLALCEDNLPTPAISDPGKYFKTVLWTGDGNSGRSIVGVGFTPDLVWIKNRNTTNNHNLYDSVRGPNRSLFSDLTNTEADYNAIGESRLFSFNNDGISIGNQTAVNGSGNSIVAWCWRAGAGTTSTNTNGSITSVVSVNQDAGFSIVSYTGSASNATVGHGLGRVPKFILIKKRNESGNWMVYHSSLTGQKYLEGLNTTSATGINNPSPWNNTDPTSSVITLLGAETNVSGSGRTYIAYCWAEIEGFSKFGSYVGNANADGPFVYCGFKPAWIMIKRTDATNDWVIFDSSRNSTNPANAYLESNTSDIETTDSGAGSRQLDILSNGFKLRDSAAAINASGGTYIFVAFAESPFKTANAK